MRREERVTVQGPVKEQQPDGMSHRGVGSWYARYPRPSRNASCARATHGVVERRGWTAGKARGGAGHLGLTHTGTQRDRLWTTGGWRRCVGSNNRQTNPATTSTTSVRQLLGTAHAQTASAATSTAPAHQPLGSTNAETTPAGAPAAAADTTQQSHATCEGENG